MQAWPETAPNVGNGTGKGMSGVDKLSSLFDRLHMELGGKFVNSLKIKTQFLKRLQTVSDVDRATHTQQGDVENPGGFFKNSVVTFCAVLLRQHAHEWNAVFCVHLTQLAPPGGGNYQPFMTCRHKALL